MLGGVRRKVIDEAEFALHVTRIAQPSLQYVACGARRKICCGGSGRVGRGPPSASGGPGRGGVRKPSAYLTAQHARRRDKVVWHMFRQWLARPGTRDVSGRIKIGEAVRMVLGTTIETRPFRTFASVNRREPVRIWCEYANTRRLRPLRQSHTTSDEISACEYGANV